MEKQLEARMAERAVEQEKADAAALAAIKVPPVKTKKAEILAKQLKENAKKDSRHRRTFCRHGFTTAK